MSKWTTITINSRWISKNPDRTPLDVLLFEAILKNFGKFSTGEYWNQWFNITSAFDRMFTGEQFNTGVRFNQYKIHPSQECFLWHSHR